MEEVKIKLPVLVGHLEGGYTKAINILMDKLVAKGLVDEESKQEKLLLQTHTTEQCTQKTTKAKPV